MRLLPKPPNRDLARDLETERFLLKSIGRLEALRLTNPWRHDPEIMLNFFRSSKPRSLSKWVRSGPIPNNRSRFTHAIIPKGEAEPIGANVVRLFDYRSASMTIALHDRQWWGKGVVLEARIRVIEHFFNNSQVERFIASVNARNAGSIFNYRRLGFAHVGTNHRNNRDPVTGEIVDIVNFELFRDQWERGPWSASEREADPRS